MSDSESTRRFLRQKLQRACKEAKQHKHQVFLELLGGPCGIARILRHQGFGVVTLDARRHPNEDLTNPIVLGVVRGWISSGAVLGVWLKAPQGLKSRRNAHLYSDLGSCFRSVIRACVQSGLPCMLEKALRNRQLFLAELVQLGVCQRFVSDFCQYGSRWRRRTQVLGWHVDSRAPCQICRGCNGLCNRTRKPHISLAGASAGAFRWRQVAQRYPRNWAKSFAQLHHFAFSVSGLRTDPSASSLPKWHRIVATLKRSLIVSVLLES